MEQVTKISPCLICGKALDPAMPSTNKFVNQPAEGITCYTTGNYGSRVLDVFTQGVEVTFNICDKCFSAHSDRMLVVQTTTKREFTYTPYNHSDDLLTDFNEFPW